jgi:hypothetical protein
MARNLQSKLPASDTLLIQDINTDATKRFVEETEAQSRGAAVKVANSVREASEHSVSRLINFLCCHTYAHSSKLCDEFILSMI